MRSVVGVSVQVLLMPTTGSGSPAKLDLGEVKEEERTYKLRLVQGAIKTFDRLATPLYTLYSSYRSLSSRVGRMEVRSREANVGERSFPSTKDVFTVNSGTPGGSV